MSKPSLHFLVSNSLHQDQRLHRICETLSKNGFETTLIGVRKDDHIFNGKVFKTISLKTLFKKGVLFYLEINVRFFFFLLFQKTDGIVANDLDTLLAAKLLSLIKNKKLFIDLHEYFTEVPELKDRKLKQSVWSFIGRLGISESSINYTVNESLAHILKGKYKSNFESIYNYPVTKNNNSTDTIEKTFDIIYVGVVNKGRGLYQAIHSIKNLDNVTLTIFGIGDELESIKNLITQLSLQSRVFLKGFIANLDIHAQLQNFDLGLNLLNSTSQNYYYSSANKYFDYLMAGIPTLTMNFPEYIKHNQEYETAILIESLDHNHIEEAILKLKNNPSLNSKLKANCKVAKKVFNWQTQETKLLNIYTTAFNL